MNSTTQITGYENIIDTRDIIERIEFLCLSIGIDTVETPDELEVAILAAEKEAAEHDDEIELDNDEYEELKELLRFQEDEAFYIDDYQHGETLISDMYFVEYAQSMAEEVGDINKTSWPYTCIDWDQAATELQQDYRGVTLFGNKYWVHS